jgi:hypothetical protein
MTASSPRDWGGGGGGKKLGPLFTVQSSLFLFFSLHGWALTIYLNHSLNTELDLQSLFRLHVHSCTHWLRPEILQLRPRNPPIPPYPLIWAHIRGSYWSAKIDDISL